MAALRGLYNLKARWIQESILESLYKLLPDAMLAESLLGDQKELFEEDEEIWRLLTSKSDTDNDKSTPIRYINRQLSGKLARQLLVSEAAKTVAAYTCSIYIYGIPRMCAPLQVL